MFYRCSKIEDRVKKGNDLFDRRENMKHVTISDNTYLPPQYDVYLTKFFDSATKNVGFV